MLLDISKKNVKLADFGTSAIISSDPKVNVPGSPIYLTPELLELKLKWINFDFLSKLTLLKWATLNFCVELK